VLIGVPFLAAALYLWPRAKQSAKVSLQPPPASPVSALDFPAEEPEKQKSVLETVASDSDSNSRRLLVNGRLNLGGKRD
jgi:hypothetical protein